MRVVSIGSLYDAGPARRTIECGILRIEGRRAETLKTNYENTRDAATSHHRPKAEPESAKRLMYDHRRHLMTQEKPWRG
jgi:hypothetical protein